MIPSIFYRPSTYIKLCILGASVAISLGFLGWLHPAFDTIAHSRLHFAAALFVAFLVMLFTRHFVSSFIAIVFSILGFFYATSGLPMSNGVPAIEEKPIYSMYHLNLFWKHAEQKRPIESIRAHDPDIISLTEASILWEESLNSLTDNWPHVYHCPEYNKRGGVMIYSKWPIEKEDTYCGTYGSLALVNVEAPDGTKFELGSSHIRWPWPASGPKQILSAKPRLKKIGKDALIAGDFNATTWSLGLKQFADHGGLKIIEGIGPSWMFDQVPEALIPLIGLPIDQVMHKGRVHIVEAKALPSVGSDHLPVLVTFQLK